MMNFFENFLLTNRNTLRLPSRARFFAAPASDLELRALINTVTARNVPLMVLGGGSNVVFAGDFQGLVVQPAMRGIHCIAETTEHYLIEAAAGEPWHEFVQYCLAQNWYGLENLSLIPGTVGASPIQNIGAYGVEITDRLHSLSAVELASGQMHEFSHADCGFAYRDSVFKRELSDRYVIVSVRFLLQKKPAVKMGYADIQHELLACGIDTPTPQQVAAAVIAIRKRKLPDPAVLANAGSFFKNPVVSLPALELIKKSFPDIIAYPQAGEAKLAAGWLIEKAGWKGRSIGPVGAYEKQALVLVNHGGGTGANVIAVASAIQQAVVSMFGVQLEMEPRIYGN
jgi:UDP-N-acetylmuramate dehydrogenase